MPEGGPVRRRPDERSRQGEDALAATETCCQANDLRTDPDATQVSVGRPSPRSVAVRLLGPGHDNCDTSLGLATQGRPRPVGDVHLPGGSSSACRKHVAAVPGAPRPEATATAASRTRDDGCIAAAMGIEQMQSDSVGRHSVIGEHFRRPCGRSPVHGAPSFSVAAARRIGWVKSSSSGGARVDAA